MATTFTTGNTWTIGDTITAAKLNNMVNAMTIATIADTDMAQLTTADKVANSALVQITTASKVSGAAITSLASIPSGAGVVPVANLGSGSPTASTVLLGSGAWGATPSATGNIAQVVNTQTGAVATGTTATPFDDTIPQITEGDQYMTQAITPTSATNKLKIDVVWQGANSNNSSYIIVALFQDSTANALAVASTGVSSASAGLPFTITFTHYMTAGTTSATTFKVRAGCPAGATITFNGISSARLYGGVAASSITITEIQV